MQDLTLGEKVSALRRRKGMTQAVLAGLCGRTTNWVSQVESGRIVVDRLSVISTLASALGVEPSALIPSALEERLDERTEVANEIKSAMSNYGQQIDPGAAIQVEKLREQALTTYRICQDGNFKIAARYLRPLIDVVRFFQFQCPDRCDRTFQASACFVYLAAEFVLTKLSRPELAWIAAEYARAHARDSGDTSLVVSAERAMVHALQANDQLEDALSLAQTVTDEYQSTWSRSDPRMAAAYGTLQLGASMAAARLGDRTRRNVFLAEAARVVERHPLDQNLLNLAFGPTNLACHKASTALELGDFHDAAKAKDLVLPADLPVERHVRHHLNTARGLVLVGRPHEAEEILLFAHKQAPWQVRNHFLTRGVVSDLLRSRRRPSSELLDLAKNSGAV